MFIAHLPAGYLLTRAIQHKTDNLSLNLLWAGLLTSLFPDLDLFYFYLIDNRQHPHHHYITHMPLAWLALALLSYATLYFTRTKRYNLYVTVIFANAMLHMLMDSVAASIPWLSPFSPVEVNLVKVPSHYNSWVLNFLLHWTFLLECTITLCAFMVWLHDRRKKA